MVLGVTEGQVGSRRQRFSRLHPAPDIDPHRECIRAGWLQGSRLARTHPVLPPRGDQHGLSEEEFPHRGYGRAGVHAVRESFLRGEREAGHELAGDDVHTRNARRKGCTARATGGDGTSEDSNAAEKLVKKASCWSAGLDTTRCSVRASRPPGSRAQEPAPTSVTPAGQDGQP